MLTKLIAGSLILLAITRSAYSVDAPPTPEDREASNQKYQLRYRFERGEFVYFEVESQTSMTVLAKGVKQTTHESRQCKQHYRVVSVADDGSAILEPVIDQAVMEARSDDDKPIRFDSRDSAPPHKAFLSVKDSIGRPIVRLRYLPNGKATEVLPISGIEKRIPTDPAVHAFLTRLPDNAIAVGESWNDDFTAPVTLRLSENRTIKKDIPIRRKYTLTKVEGSIATIEFRTYPREIVREPDQQAQLIQRSLSGAIKFDVARGLQIEMTSSGSNIVHGPFGPASSMQTTASNVERLVPAPRAAQQPAGPELPVVEKLSAAK